MLRHLKTLLLILLSLVFLLVVGVYVSLNLSLPKLSGEVQTSQISAKTSIGRDRLGTAVIHAENRQDAAFALGFAHGQDRFFQMDLLRRNSAGELAELFGKPAVKLDESRRFHQLRKRAEHIYRHLPTAQQQLLQRYADGVNRALAAQSLPSFEYLLTRAKREPWRPADSLLVIYSMYLDLQGNGPKRDLALDHIERSFGPEMRSFITQTSNYQAALDNSLFPSDPPAIPKLSPSPSPSVSLQQSTASTLAQRLAVTIEEPIEVGSNNWAVTGKMTRTGSAMLSDDMHLSFAVPIIWYRAQLNYPDGEGKAVQVTGVSLPGAPAIVVGSNGKLAWGFTNAYIDTADWVALDKDEPLEVVHETIKLPKGEQDYAITLSRFGPVRHLGEQAYALAWVAHQEYAVNMELMALEQIDNVPEAMAKASGFGIPVQNLMLADDKGHAAWQLAGAVPARTNSSDIALPSEELVWDKWQERDDELPSLQDPASDRLWSANARVMSTQEAQRYGDGGYALGARSAQIRDRLLEQELFDESDFYRIQLDNQARFYRPWQAFLLQALMREPKRFAKDIVQLRDWQECACAESVGFTLVKAFRSQMLDSAFAPVEAELNSAQLSLSVLKRYLEPAIWQLLKQQPTDWLPQDVASWDELVVASYVAARDELLDKYSEDGELSALNWGRVNTLAIQHPFSRQFPLLSRWLDMPKVAGFGDTFMPAVQRKSFGASQRFIVQPGYEERAIMAIPGGQSGHPLSKYYRAGFSEYARGAATPLLPGEIEAKLILTPSQAQD
ncbi:penicillin acylase family protein [Shewanella alkalitolerans]|uniref:penicillin acylase family protein n=1 Tax=Shewanella alkalitolerans TaxID=2864209 RepID=UPI001C6576F2|nr:penicillin acylase family protein [Shewanella alkalitolerans]QYJ96589.1 penicillin acylase family protein [Shewanella alkalitolerans]